MLPVGGGMEEAGARVEKAFMAPTPIVHTRHSVTSTHQVQVRLYVSLVSYNV